MKAPSVEALLSLAQENGVILLLENAVELYTALHREMGAVPDESLDAVTGGSATAPWLCPLCNTELGIVQAGELRYKCLNPRCEFTSKIGI